MLHQLLCQVVELPRGHTCTSAQDVANYAYLLVHACQCAVMSQPFEACFDRREGDPELPGVHAGAQQDRGLYLLW